jgi:hypothetical protein
MGHRAYGDVRGYVSAPRSSEAVTHHLVDVVGRIDKHVPLIDVRGSWNANSIRRGFLSTH